MRISSIVKLAGLVALFGSFLYLGLLMQAILG
jgi:hypothetical protein